MFIHFAFGALGKQGNIKDQTQQVIEYILKEKRLKVTKCLEFLPVYPKKGAKKIPIERFKPTSNGVMAGITSTGLNGLRLLPDDKNIHYLPVDVPMICFIKISFNKLKSSTHMNEYGRSGLVLTDTFLTALGIRPVHYYTEDSLWDDPLIKKWNDEANSSRHNPQLQKEIVSYRKPATLFPSFRESVTMRLSKTSSEFNIKYLTYDRYKEGYDFTNEQEHRIVFEEGVEYLYFNENDLFMVLTPDSWSKDRVEMYFRVNWTKKPEIRIFPS